MADRHTLFYLLADAGVLRGGPEDDLGMTAMCCHRVFERGRVWPIGTVAVVPRRRRRDGGLRLAGRDGCPARAEVCVTILTQRDALIESRTASLIVMPPWLARSHDSWEELE
jgi:hypothetical protein